MLLASITIPTDACMQYNLFAFANVLALATEFLAIFHICFLSLFGS